MLFDYSNERWNQSIHLEEVTPSTLSQQHQKLSVIDLTVTVQISLVNHLLNVKLINIHRVRSHDMLDILLVQLTVLILVQLLELFSQEFFTLLQSTVQETSNELSIVDLTTVIEVHSLENLLNVCISQFTVNLLLEVIKADYHFLPRNHTVTIFIQFQKDLTQVFNLLLGHLDCQVHQNGLLQTI